MENFRTAKGEKISFGELVKNIKNFIEEDKKFNYQILIGTDSEDLQSFSVEFISAIVVHRIGQGGRYFWQRKIEKRKMNLKERVWQEAILSFQLAQKLLNHFQKTKFSLEEVRLEIHIDIGWNGPTKAIIQEITKFIRSQGLIVKIKPDSFAASKIADRYL